MADESALNGARQIVKHCLGLEAGQELLVFMDETTVEVGMLLEQAATQLGVTTSSLFVSRAQQRSFSSDAGLGRAVSGALREVRVIVLCVNGQTDCLPFRAHIIEHESGARTRIGTMPGASHDVLRMADVDFARLIADCRRLELALTRGSRLCLASRDARGEEHRLEVDIGGWGRLPVASDGIIREGTWGNVPSGESFIAPVEDSAEGSVVIDGSIPGQVIGPGEEIVLYFSGGRLQGIEPTGRRAAQLLRATEIDPARARDDPNWNNLAEIGIGVNPAVTTLTGNMLYDEKAAGTAHIAIGSNIFFGGQRASSIHCDMVIRRPTITIDEKVVVADGAIRYAERDWREHFARVSLHGSPLREAREVGRSGVGAEMIDGRLVRVARSEAGRNSMCPVGDDETAHLAALIYQQLPVNGHSVALERLRSHLRSSDQSLRQVLHVMRDYGLIRLGEQGGEPK
ncbi:MAG TPA: aminopeptidase [Chloroflexaceae bacterium]|nr:aminopeptidase [Chloroflexaceae bacterium]